MNSENTEKSITQDVTEVFEEIWQEIRSNYFASGKHDLSYVREALRESLPTTIVNKNLLLMDTVLNYLTKDASETLKNVDSKVINMFYEWDRQQTEKLKTEFKNTISPKVSLSSDLRVKYGTIAGVGGAGGTSVIASNLLGKTVVEEIAVLHIGLAALLAIGVGVLAYKLIYQASTSTATEQIKEDINQYLQTVQKTTLRSLQWVIEEYKQQFNRFTQQTQGVH